MDTTSYWIDSAPMPRHSPPTEDVSVDVVVIGGGITGITAAYLLKEAGCKVALVERAEFASIDTGHTTAHVTCVTDTSLTELARTFGDERARAVWDSGRAALDRMTDLIRREAIDCDFRWAPAWVHAPLGQASDDDVQTLRVEGDTARRLGISAQFYPRVPQYGAPGVGFPRQALFHPRKYLAALLRRIPGQGSHVFEGEPAEVTTAEPLAVSVAGRRLRAADLVIATHNPLTGISGTTSAMLFQTKLSLYTSYALGARAPAGSLEEGSFWDTSDPYYYLRQDRHRDHDYAIFGGEDHKTGQETDTVGVYRKLEDAFRRYLPEARIDHRWSGQVIETNDGLPFIGRSEDHQYVATGYAGNGMTFGTLAGLMVTDAITGRKNPWEELYDPHRKTVVGGTWAYLKENKDYPLYLVKNWLAKAEGESLESLRPNEGKILSLEGRKVAAFRADDGKVTLCSPVCTHLQCIVAWNPAERTWDCPCHGSRFQPTGEVISGPAEEPLERLDPPST